MLFLPPILLTVIQCCEQEYHQQQLVRYQPFLERRGDWTYCALAIRSDHSEVKISNLSGYNSRHLRIETYHVKSNVSVAVIIFVFFLPDIFPTTTLATTASMWGTSMEKRWCCLFTSFHCPFDLKDIDRFKSSFNLSSMWVSYFVRQANHVRLSMKDENAPSKGGIEPTFFRCVRNIFERSDWNHKYDWIFEMFETSDGTK